MQWHRHIFWGSVLRAHSCRHVPMPGGRTFSRPSRPRVCEPLLRLDGTRSSDRLPQVRQMPDEAKKFQAVDKQRPQDAPGMSSDCRAHEVIQVIRKIPGDRKEGLLEGGVPMIHSLDGQKTIPLELLAQTCTDIYEYLYMMSYVHNILMSLMRQLHSRAHGNARARWRLVTCFAQWNQRRRFQRHTLSRLHILGLLKPPTLASPTAGDTLDGHSDMHVTSVHICSYLHIYIPWQWLESFQGNMIICTD